MSSSFKLSAVPVVASLACVLSCGVLAPAARAATPITVTSQSALDGPIRYTVRVTSKQFGNSQETRTIRSGQSDDFTWKTVPPGGAIPAADACPNYASLPLDSNGAMIRQTQIRLAPVVADDGTATVQLNFQAHKPDGVKTVTANGKSLKCPNDVSMSQVLRFTMPVNGSTKTLTLSDGTTVAISAKR
ncbi:MULTISPECIES: DUF6013 family protein [Paraburkholderia]|jgi:hypothetical protein|uniref:Uncharacterized protein n=2 Tax=Paraburkholderia TaxID=1822464 RepID=A0AB73I986_9BURK|nr:DUF6013 family protein [Paraburkholderia caledonica]TCF99020.1 hypothetical protein BZM26_21530 [Paraburkholderia strydomiana]MDP9646314.1 hypothetical protein [Paraburkholderia caledonica]MDR6373790.1 hypothetical protein [Paraburkholderia caledonica]CAH2894326.1 MAG: FIG00453584: hypothetical protein [uncultured Paraburkholderia sp.]CAH2911219.1 MAG: FIG00453584: hypothetical protein [uncultured Paraburkholderia sp.]